MIVVLVIALVVSIICNVYAACLLAWAKAIIADQMKDADDTEVRDAR